MNICRDEKQPDYDPGRMAFRLTAEKSDYQPMQEITVWWDGQVDYTEEPPYLRGHLFLAEEDLTRDKSRDLHIRFGISEREINLYISKLTQCTIDETGRYCTDREPIHKGGECWIELSTPHGIAGIDWEDPPMIEPAVERHLEEGEEVVEGGQIPETVETIWARLTCRSYEESLS